MNVCVSFIHAAFWVHEIGEKKARDLQSRLLDGLSKRALFVTINLTMDVVCIYVHKYL